MIELHKGYRQATPGDALPLAELVNMAGEGMPLYLWEKMAEEGQAPWDVGQQRARRDSGGFSYRNTIVREHEGVVVAALIGYPLEDDPEPVDYTDMPPMFVPLQQLEDRAPGTWYVNVLATYPEMRGNGYGTEMLSLAEDIAHHEGKRGLSLIVTDSNIGARRLYQRMGYHEAARRPMVKEQFQHPGEQFVLMLKLFKAA